MALGIADYAISDADKAKANRTPLEVLRDVVSGKDDVTVKVAEVYPINAPEFLPLAPTPAPTAKNADFYRDGKFSVGTFLDESDGNRYDITPRRHSGWEYDERYASIRLYGKKTANDKTTVETDLLPPYTKFFLESVNEGHAEKTQIVETFGKFYVYAFGERPPMYTFSGKLLSTKNADWAADFSFLYDQYLRATKAVERDARAVITYNGKQIEGLIVALATSRQADVDGLVPFQIQVIVYDRKFLNFSNDFGYSTEDGKSLLRDDNFRKMLDQVTGTRTGFGTSDPQLSQVHAKVKDVMTSNEPARGIMGGGGTANA